MNSVCLQYTQFRTYLCEIILSIRKKRKLTLHCDTPPSITYDEITKNLLKQLKDPMYQLIISYCLKSNKPDSFNLS